MMVSSIILRTSMRLILPLSLLFACYMSLKGHNEPGGGFIAGLVASIAFCIYRMSFGAEALLKLLPVHPRMLIFLGLGMACATSLTPLLFGLPLLTSRVGTISLPLVSEPFHYASAMIFDTGVLLVVVGVSVGMIMRLSEELE